MGHSTHTPWVSDYDLYLLAEGTHYHAYEKMGAHLGEVAGQRGVHFAVWAPNATQVSVIGDFNGWNPRSNALRSRGAAGVWEGFVPDVEPGARYEYYITSRYRGYEVDKAGLGYFDGTHLYEHSDPRQGEQPDWDTFVFNYGRCEVRGFLIANALFCFDKYHIDGLRVDAVASMLYLDYGRGTGQWIPNQYGGRENIDALQFLRQMNEQVYAAFPDAMMVAEESTAWPMVSRPTYLGGLGFDLKSNMGWMHDTLESMSKDPIYRRYYQNKITFSLVYAFSENFVLPLSHDEMVYGKGSMVAKMPGDDWCKFANLRLLYGYMWGHPGKKLLFMGGDFGQRSEWSHDRSLAWDLLERPLHSGLRRWVRDLNTFYRGQPSLYEVDFEPSGFEWVDCGDSEGSVLSFLRRAKDPADVTLFICNFTPMPRHDYRVGAPVNGYWREALNSDALSYGGSGQGNSGSVEAVSLSLHGRPYSMNLTIPPLGVLVLQPGVRDWS